jgi:hypothetical protein
VIPLLLPALLTQASLGDWKVARTVTFSAANLYGHIDGGAELFLEYGFETLAVQFLQAGPREMTLETYRMAGPEAALGIYLDRCGKETPQAGLPLRHTASPQQVLILKGRNVVMLNNPSGQAADLPGMVKLLNQALAALPDEKGRDLWALLPAEGRVQGTEFMVRGQYGLQNVVTLGEGDTLSLGGRHWAVGADYRDAQGATSTRLQATYSDTATAETAFATLLRGLDPTLKVLEKGKDRIVFQDFQNRYGVVTRVGAGIQMVFKLVGRP